MSQRRQRFRLFADCVPVKGTKESIICNLTEGFYFTIPNVFFEILKNNSDNDYTISQLKEYYKGEFSKGIEKYFTFLVKNNVGFYDYGRLCYQKINFLFDSPNIISNSIIEINYKTSINFHNVISQLQKFGCQVFEIRIGQGISKKMIWETLEKYDTGNIRMINIILKYNNSFTVEDFSKIIYINKRINRLIIHSILDSTLNVNHKRILFTKKNICDIEYKNDQKLVLNKEAFIESQNYNLALNKKLCIDAEGNIKNDLNHTEIFGNVNNQSISDILNKNELQIKWNINNDIIEKCKICQYRYICFSTSDIEKINNKWFKKYECKFDPIINQWTN